MFRTRRNFKSRKSKKKLTELKELFKEKKVELTIFSNPKELNPFPGNWILFPLSYYSKNYFEELDFFYSRAKETSNSINTSTKEYFSKLWFRNYILNLKSSLEKKNITFVEKKNLSLEGKTVLFTGASPELENSIEIIKKYRNRFFLISSDTSNFFLIKNNIIPDMIISLDSGRGTTYHFREFDLKIPILTWFGGNRELFIRNYPLYIYLTTYPLDQLLHKMVYPELNLFSNSSLNVAGMAKSISEELGAREFIITGVNFTSISGKSHCQGSGYESYLLPFVNRTFSLEFKSNYGYLKNINKKNQIAKEKIFSSPIIKNLSEEHLKKSPLVLNNLRESEININRLNSFVPILKSEKIKSLLQKELSLTSSSMNRILKLI